VITTRILNALAELTGEGDFVRLALHGTEDDWHAELRGVEIISGAKRDYPVFDPIDGLVLFAGRGQDALSALADLDRVLEPFCPELPVEEPSVSIHSPELAEHPIAQANAASWPGRGQRGV